MTNKETHSWLFADFNVRFPARPLEYLHDEQMETLISENFTCALNTHSVNLHLQIKMERYWFLS